MKIMVEKYDYIIVGQGIAGTLLSWFLMKKGKTFLVIDNNHDQSASKVAAGIINPITGRKYVKSWRIEDLLPFAKTTYFDIAKFLKTDLVHEKLIFRGLYSIKDENTWEARKSEAFSGMYIVENPDISEFEDKIRDIYKYGVIKNGIQVQLPKLIKKYREYLIKNALILNEKLDYDKIDIKEDVVKYKNLECSKLLFAEGYQSEFNPYFKYLPYAPAKGDVLIVKIKGNPFENLLRNKIFIAPMEDDLYWVGSKYQWEFEDDAPDKEKGRELKDMLDKMLNVPYEIVDHIAGIRPCVDKRRPLLGPHPDHPNLYIFNGLGTKGTSLGPYWASHLVDHLTYGLNIDEDVAIV